MEKPENRLSILNLPNEMLFFIFSYLSHDTQIIISEVCSHFYAVINDSHLWQKRLLKETGVWNASDIIDRDNFSNDYIHILRTYEADGPIRAVISDANKINKTLFSMCSPRANSKRRRLQLLKNEAQTSLFSKFSSLLWNSTKEIPVIPKFIMFGPGLETSGISVIARKIVSGRSSMFEVVGMLDGGAVAVKYERELFHLAILYSTIKALRKPLSVTERLCHNKLFTEESNGIWQVANPVKKVCLNANAIIYVMDATTEIENVEDPFPDLTLMIQEALLNKNTELTGETNTSSSLYLLILACIPDNDSHRLPLLTLLNGLNLWKYNIPWQICLVTASSLLNISLGFNWLMAHIRQLGKKNV